MNATNTQTTTNAQAAQAAVAGMAAAMPSSAGAVTSPWYKSKTTKIVAGAVVLGGLGVIAEKKFGVGSKLVSMMTSGAGTVAETTGAVVGFFRK